MVKLQKYCKKDNNEIELPVYDISHYQVKLIVFINHADLIFSHNLNELSLQIQGQFNSIQSSEFQKCINGPTN